MCMLSEPFREEMRKYQTSAFYSCLFSLNEIVWPHAIGPREVRDTNPGTYQQPLLADLDPHCSALGFGCQGPAWASLGRQHFP